MGYRRPFHFCVPHHLSSSSSSLALHQGQQSRVGRVSNPTLSAPVGQVWMGGGSSVRGTAVRRAGGGGDGRAGVVGRGH